MGAWIEILQETGERMTIGSHPTMGAWIEIAITKVTGQWLLSHPTMGAWIEIIVQDYVNDLRGESHPTMGAWIEISNSKNQTLNSLVAPHDGCVD